MQHIMWHSVSLIFSEEPIDFQNCSKTANSSKNVTLLFWELGGQPLSIAVQRNETNNKKTPHKQAITHQAGSAIAPLLGSDPTIC